FPGKRSLLRVLGTTEEQFSTMIAAKAIRDMSSRHNQCTHWARLLLASNSIVTFPRIARCK
ncbi:hypothetical protein FGB62_107g02, partial [Gracilaria domingensis]